MIMNTSGGGVDSARNPFINLGRGRNWAKSRRRRIRPERGENISISMDAGFDPGAPVPERVGVVPFELVIRIDSV
ncbi:hypothetical protein HJC23_002771 [Cyclotella cryptica]|uniref:Peptidylprolyl isomerase n=1 Tax=Cyclotella cryptica TaxID=29204 RepID=A0ABD3PFL5_9STRA